MVERSSRVTHAQAAEILGCSVSNIPKLLRAGHLTSATPRGKAALEREQVEQLAAAREHAVAERERLRAEREAPRDHRDYEPDAEHTWLTPDEAGVLIGISGQAVRKRCRRGTIPHTRAGRVYWIRADHAQLAANVRAADDADDVLQLAAPQPPQHDGDGASKD